MRKCTFWLLMILLCLLPLMAMASDAETMKPLPRDMISFTPASGLALKEYAIKDGEISLSINVDETDWEAVYLNTGAMSDIFHTYSIRVPEGADYVYVYDGNFPEEAIPYIDFWEQEKYGRYGRPVADMREEDGVRYLTVGSRVATWVDELASVIVDDSPDLWHVMLRWYEQTGVNEAGNAICTPIATHKLKIARTVDQYGLIPVDEPVKASANRVIVDASDVPHLHDVETSVEDGIIYLKPLSEDAYCEDNELYVLLELPRGAVSWSDTGDGDRWEPIERNGKQYADWWVWQDDLFNTNRKSSRVFWFFDANGNVVEKLALNCRLKPLKNANPSEAYMMEATGGELDNPDISWKMEWKTVPQPNMKINSPIPNSVYEVKYTNGMLKTAMKTGAGNGSRLADYKDSGITIDIIAPDRAKSFRMNNSGDSNWGKMDADYYIRKHANVADGDVYPVINGKARVWDSSSVLRTIDVVGSDLTLFFPVEYNAGDKNYKQTNMIYFYDVLNPTPETKPIAQWYYNRMDDHNFFLTTTTRSYESISDIPADQLDPCIVDPLKRGWELRVRYYLQKGNKARHYELSVVDENGKTVKLKKNEGVFVYFPYPADKDAKYKVHHFGNDLYTAWRADYTTVDQVQYAEHGLFFYTESFSPYVVNWGGNASGVQTLPPKTGDSMPLGLVCAASLLSLAAFTVLLGRRRHS